YIKSPSFKAEMLAIRNNESAMKFICDLNKTKILKFLKENILVLKYVINEITMEELEEVLKEVLSKDDVEEKYVRDYLNYHMIDDSEIKKMDKLKIIYVYGSKKAKKIAVDERLKMN
ncbi:MAG: hypothetical protein K0S18_1006, partial [Anaerocolumna sp.]|nr:hypothetical protein [Anaerocolumna sp.]